MPQPMNRAPLTANNPNFVIAKSMELDDARYSLLIDKVSAISDETASSYNADYALRFTGRHRNLAGVLDKALKRIEEKFPDRFTKLSKAQKTFLGYLAIHEYSIEAAALFNPSIVPHPDQSETIDGHLKVIVSMRAVGEGHISSIVFREGIVDPAGRLTIHEPQGHFETPVVLSKKNYVSAWYRTKVQHNVNPDVVSALFDFLPPSFTANELWQKMNTLDLAFMAAHDNKTTDLAILKDRLNVLIRSDYEITFADQTSLDQRAIFPVSPEERKGLEDVRFVAFVEDDGNVTYIGTYTAYDGSFIQPKLIKTYDFKTFETLTLSGDAAQNKGLALFPRKINGQYAMLSRQGGVDNHIMFSNDFDSGWETAQRLEYDRPDWSMLQEGNCGSPLETEKGWLVITHGVGGMREYCISAILLDLKDPTKVIGVLDQPLLKPTEQEREGYVPNVVYSCGSLIRKNPAGEEILVLPYAASDQNTAAASFKVDEILAEMRPAFKNPQPVAVPLSPKLA